MRLVEASQEGRLCERARAEQFEGVQREMMQGVNTMLEAILLPIGEGTRILAQISAGRIDELIAQTYKGNHEFMRCLSLQARRHRATPHPAEIDATGSLAEVAKDSPEDRSFRSFRRLILAASKAVDNARGQAQIILTVNRSRRISKRSVLIVALNANAKWSEERLFESSTHGVRWTRNPPIQVRTPTHRHRTLHPAGSH
jgi:hypothetical protein